MTRAHTLPELQALHGGRYRWLLLFAVASIVAFIYGMALFGSTYLLPVYMQLALQLPAFNASFLMLTALCLLAMPAAWQLRTPPAASRPPGVAP